MKRSIIDLSDDTDDGVASASVLPPPRLMCRSFQHPSLVPSRGWVATGNWSELFLEGTPYPDEESVEVDEVLEDVCASHVRLLIGSIGERMREADEFVQANSHRVSWHLAAPEADIVNATIAHINAVLADQFVREFYIGLTARLPQRWFGETKPFNGRPPMRGHRYRFQEMVIVGVSGWAEEIEDAETRVIAHFRPTSTHVGDFRCQNKSPGGEGARGGVPPHCLYVCWTWNPE